MCLSTFFFGAVFDIQARPDTNDEPQSPLPKLTVTDQDARGTAGGRMVEESERLP